MMPPFLQAGAWLDIGFRLSLPVENLVFGAWVLSLQLWPIVALILWAGARRLDPSLLDAARLAMPSSRAWGRIVLPLLAPALALGSLAVFILALNHFIVPTTFQTRVQITSVYVGFSTLYDTRAALLQSIPIWMLSLAALGVAAWLGARRFGHDPNRHAVRPDEAPPLPPLRLLLPALILLIVSLAPPLVHLLTWSVLRDVVSTLQLAAPSFGASLIYAAGGTIFAVALGLIGWRLFPKSLLAEAVFATPFILSGLFLGIALIAVGQFAGIAAWWQGTWFLGLAALAVRFAWIPLRAVRSARAQIRTDVFEAAQLFRLSRRDVFHHIEWPALKPALLAAAWLVFLLALWDVETLVLIYPPGGEPVSLRIFQLLHNRYDSQVGVLSLALLAIGLAPLPLALAWKAVCNSVPRTSHD
jgi:iron(III) transport system permease protein